MTQLMMNDRTKQKKPLLAKLPTGPVWVEELRKSGARRFEESGYPTDEKLEAWRFTNLRPIVETEWTPAVADEATAESVYKEYTFGEDAFEIVLTNGHFSPKLTQLENLPKGLTVQSLAAAFTGPNADVVKAHLANRAKPEENPFVALNQANLHGGVFIHIKRESVIEKPVHIVCIATPTETPTANYPRILVVIEDAAQATIVQSFASTTYTGVKRTYLTNAVTEFVIGNDAIVDHYKMNQESLDAYHIAAMDVIIGRNTQFIDHNASIGSSITRNDITVKLNGENSYSVLNGLTIIGGTQFVDNHTLLEHAYPNCPSYELYKHVLDGRAQGIFKGKIFVHDVAQKTDAKQSSKTLLLSDDARMNSQPALEIYADDVKCTHGSTTGPLDDGMLFYLQTRGLSAQQAKQVLIYAFVADVTRRIKVEPVRNRLENWMANQQGLPSDFRIQELGAHDDDVVY
jgi:Fe-S cluster assembly protein SufD